MTRSADRPGRGLKVSGLVLTVIGALLAAGSLVGVIRGIGGTVLDTLTGPLYTAPTEVSVHLNHRHNQLLQQTGTATTLGLGSTNVPVVITPDLVRVLDPSGAVVPTQQASGNFTLTRDRSRFTSAVTFDAGTVGDYRIAVSAPPGTNFLVVPDVSASARASAGWFAGLGLGLLVFLAGFVLLLVGFGRQRGGGPGGAGPGGAGRPIIHYGSDQVSYGAPTVIQFGAPPGGLPPGMPTGMPRPGWYPNPAGNGPPRYFDGTHWR